MPVKLATILMETTNVLNVIKVAKTVQLLFVTNVIQDIIWLLGNAINVRIIVIHVQQPIHALVVKMVII